MIRWLVLALGLIAGAAGACPPPSETLLFHSCWGTAEAELVLLPEDALPARGDATLVLLVSGAYTGTVARDGDRPNPVGLFVDGGRVVNPNLARMDGILILPEDGPPELQHRARVSFAGRRHDLRRPAERHAFARAAAAAGASVLQSHLLVVDGLSDVSEQPDAPSARRRVFFTGPQGWGVWQSAGPETLFTATAQLSAAHAPRMAFNLDMGSFDYCWRGSRDRGLARCGVRGRDDLSRLSNLLALTLH